MMRSLAALLLLMVWVPPASAQTTQAAHDDGKAFGQAAGATATGVADDEANASSNIPGYAGANAPESSYLNDPAALDSAKATAARGNEASRLVIDGSSTRPVVAQAVVDETVSRGEVINQDPATYVQGVSANGSSGQCVELPPSTNSPGTYEESCNAGAQPVPEPRSCNVTLRHNFTNANDYRCTKLTLGATGQAPTSTSNSGCDAYVTPSCSLTLEARVPVWALSGCGPGFCFAISWYQETYKASCSAPVAGTTSGAAWTHPVTQVVYTPSFTPIQTYTGSTLNESQCAGLAADPGCSGPVDVCTDSAPATRDVGGGTMVTKSCWGWSRTYQCTKIVSNNDCSALQAKPGCSYTRTECLDDSQSGPCKVENRVYTCPIPGSIASPKQYLCGGDIYCVGGDCEAVTREASDEFKDAVVGMESLAQAKREFSDIDFKLFKGTVMGCHKPIFGLVNCCAGKSSGLIATSTGFTALAGGPVAIAALATPILSAFLCSAAEKEYDVRDRMGLCHTVGTYCSSRFLGICTSKRTNACCFLSKLTRILQEQGRAQLGKGWGVPKTPECSGFTIDEFARLDLSRMDFTEVYKEFVDAAKLPGEAQAMTDIQAKIEAYYRRGGPQ